MLPVTDEICNARLRKADRITESCHTVKQNSLQKVATGHRP